MAIIFELYEALKSAGVDDEKAKAKATAEKFEYVLENKFDAELQHIVTKEYLGLELAKMETRIIKWNVGTIIAVVGITVAIVKLIS